LIGDVCVDEEGTIIIAKIARIKGGQQRTPLNPKALSIGRRKGPRSPDHAQGKLVMIIDEDRVTRFQCGFTQEPAAGFL
jgi:hypothetical protein